MDFLLKFLVFLGFTTVSFADYVDDYYGQDDITCAVVDCLPDFTCKMINRKPKCVPVSGGCDFACADIFKPVCGSDRKTYPNACELKRASCEQKKNITIVSKGACPPTSCAALLCAQPKICQVINGFAKCVCNQICTLDFDPVCGSDGVTYSNLCQLKSKACVKNKKITIVSKGACPPTSCAALLCAKPKICQVINGFAKCVCNQICTLEFDPVCGSDGVTYSNLCQLKSKACVKNKKITVVSKGACPASCAAVLCASPKRCEVINGIAQCVCPRFCPANFKYKYTTSCAALLCAQPKICQVINGFAKCVCNQICTLEFDPVCGSDGVTYSNLCQLKSKACAKNKKITVVSKGACPKASCAAVLCASPKVCQVINGIAKCVCPRFCPANFMPVCGSDGKTYSNLCGLNVAACKNKNIKKVGDGPCPTPTKKPTTYKMPTTKKRCPDVCPQVYDPVCGSDNKTYSNACFLGIEKCKNNPSLRILYRGKCVPGCEGKSCPGKHSACHMIKDKPTCVRVCHPCPVQKQKQVCGSDGKTYNNRCELERAACKSQKKITVAHIGSCKPPSITCANILCKIHTVCRMIKGKPHCISTCPKVCSKIHRPVCGSDGVLYGNGCLMRLAACKQEKIITAVSMSKCKHACNNYKCTTPPYSKCENVNGRSKCVCKFMCPRKQELVCGSDGKTYDNVCLMRKTACLTNKKITIASKSLCKDPCRTVKCGYYAVCKVQYNKAVCVCNKACPKIRKPVCGSNGKTYNNECLLRLDSCTLKKYIRVAHQGRCNPCRTVKCGYYAVCKVQYNKAACVCNKACTKILKPVCGSNGKTYNNECLLRVDSCTLKKHIKVEYEGRCSPIY